MNNPVGFRTVGFREWDLSLALSALAQLGYDGVELCLEHPTMRPERMDTEACRRWADATAATGLAVASVSYHGDGEDHVSRATNQVEAVRIAADLGAHVLILNAETLLPGREADQWAEFAALLREQVLPRAADRGLKVGLEPEPGHFLHGTADLLRLLAELDHPALGANLDVGHAWLTDQDLQQTVRQLAPRLWHLHWEDFPAGQHEHLVPGTGDMPLHALHAVLGQVGYAGYYTVDLFRITADPLRYAADSLAALRAMFAASGG